MPQRCGVVLAYAIALIAAGIFPWSPTNAQEECNPADEWWDAGSNYEYVYNASVDIQHTAAGRTASAGFTFSCAVIINGEEPCLFSLKLSTCRLDDRTGHANKNGRQHSFNRLLKRGHVHFRLAGGEVDQLLADPKERAFVTNVRRGVLNVLRVDRNLLTRPGQTSVGECERTVSRLPDGKLRVERSRGCDRAQNVPLAQSFFSILPSLHWVERHFAVESSCDYDTSSERILSAECQQTWKLNQPTADDVQVIVKQQLGRFMERSTDPPRERNTKQVPLGLVLDDADPYIDVDDSSVLGRLRELVSTSTPMMTPETPARFSGLLRALRTDYENPLRMADNCSDCSRFEKSLMSELAPSAVLQCGSAPCVREVANMVREGHISAARLTPLFITWHWHLIRDVQTAHRMFTLCELAPTRWCLLGLASALRRSSGSARGAGAGDLRVIVDRLRRKATDLAGPQCRGGDANVLMALKTFSNMGDLAFNSGQVTNLVRMCMVDATRPVMISSEAVRTLSAVQLSPKFAKHFRTVMESDQYPLLTRQLAYLTLLRKFPTERTFRGVISWATSTPSDPLSGFILRHWKNWPLTGPHRDIMLRVANSEGVALAKIPDDPFNSPSISSLREFRLDEYLKMALPSVPKPTAGISLYRLHGASFLPHLLQFDTELSLGSGAMTPVQLEFRAEGLERFAHDLVRDPQFDPTTVRGMLRELASVVLAGFGGKYGGDSFVTPAEAESEPGSLRLSPAVTSWLRGVLHSLQTQTALPEARPRAVITLTVMGGQVAYVTADDLLERLAALEPPPDPYHVLGEKLFHVQTIFKFIESQHKMGLAVGLPLEVVADGSVAANGAAEVSSRLGDSYRHMKEAFNGDAQISASAGLSLVLGLEVALPPFARAGLQLNTTVYMPFSLNASYALSNRTIRFTAPKPDHKRTLLLVRHGAQLRQGDHVRPSPAADYVHHHCVPQAVYTGLRVCRRLRHSGRVGLTAPLSFHITGENPDPEFHTYTLDFWTSGREDGYVHGGMFHLLLHQPAAAAQPIRAQVAFRLKPINFNPDIFRGGQRMNTTVDLRVGDFDEPLWHLYAMRAREEREDVLFTETRGWVIKEGITATKLDLEQVSSLPWVAGVGGDHRSELALDVVRMGDRLLYRRRYRAAPRVGADADLSAELRYRTTDAADGSSDSIVYRNTRIERLLAPDFYTREEGATVAWLQLNYTRRLTANDQLTELGWSHVASAVTPGVSLTGLLNLTSTADSSARLRAHVTASRTGTADVFMFRAAEANYQRKREGADITDLFDGSITSPMSTYSGTARLDWLRDSRLLTNVTVASGSGWDGSLSAALEPAAGTEEPFKRKLTARLQVPVLETVTLESEFSAPMRPKPWLPWYRDEYTFSQSSQLYWSRYDATVLSSLHVENTSEALDVSAAMSVAHAQNAPAASSDVRLNWERDTGMWNSMVVVDTPALVFNNTIASNAVGAAGMARELRQTASSPYLYLLDHSVQASLSMDCVTCTIRKRDFDMKLTHKWLRLHADATRNYTDASGPGGQLNKLGVRLDSSADFLPSMECQLKPSGNFDMTLTLPSAGPKPKLDIKYTKQGPDRRSRKQVVTRAVDIAIQPDPRGRAIPALHVSLETTPGDPSRLAAEFQVQPSLWLSTASSLVQKLQMTAAGAQRAVHSRLADKKYWLNELLRPLTGTNTVLEFLPQIPGRLKMAAGWLLHRLLSLAEPWHAVTTPIYRTLRNIYRTAVGVVMETTAGLRQRAAEAYMARKQALAQGPSLKERAMGALPRQLLGRLMQRLGQLQQEAWRRLPFQFQVTVVPPGRQRLEITNLPDYANVETIWNLSAVVRERMSRPSPLSELLATPDDRRPLAVVWADGRVLALDGHSFVLPASDGCRHLLLADVEQRSFSVLRSSRHLVATFADCNVLVNDRGQAHVERFNVTLPDLFRTSVEEEPGRLLVRSRFGLSMEVDVGCGVTLFRLDPWMVARTAGLLASMDHAHRSTSDAWKRYRLDEAQCGELDASLGPQLEVDACGRIETPECTQMKTVETAARQQRRVCAAPSPQPLRLRSSGPQVAPPSVRVLLAVADPAVTSVTVRQLTEAIRKQLTDLAQRPVQYALVADGGESIAWVEDPSSLDLEGHKLAADRLVDTLHAVMTKRPFSGPPAHRVLVVFAQNDQLRGGAALTGLRRQLWSRHVTLQLVTPLRQLHSRYQLPSQLRLLGLRWDGAVVSGDPRRQITVPQHQGDLGQLVVATSGVVWDSSTLSGADEGGATVAADKDGAAVAATRRRAAAGSAELIADSIWEHITSTEPGPALGWAARSSALTSAAPDADAELKSGNGAARAPPSAAVTAAVGALLAAARWL